MTDTEMIERFLEEKEAKQLEEENRGEDSVLKKRQYYQGSSLQTFSERQTGIKTCECGRTFYPVLHKTTGTKYFEQGTLCVPCQKKIQDEHQYRVATEVEFIRMTGIEVPTTEYYYFRRKRSSILSQNSNEIKKFLDETEKLIEFIKINGKEGSEKKFEEKYKIVLKQYDITLKREEKERKYREGISSKWEKEFKEKYKF